MASNLYSRVTLSLLALPCLSPICFFFALSFLFFLLCVFLDPRPFLGRYQRSVWFPLKTGLRLSCPCFPLRPVLSRSFHLSARSWWYVPVCCPHNRAQAFSLSSTALLTSFPSPFQAFRSGKVARRVSLPVISSPDTPAASPTAAIFSPLLDCTCLVSPVLFLVRPALL